LLAAAPSVAGRSAEAATEVARRELADTTSVHRAAAALLCGALRDEAAVPALVALCGSDDAYERRCAGRSLRLLTGLEFGDEHEPWERWHDRELRWFRDVAPTALAALAADDPAATVAALHEISARRLRQAELARAVVAATRHASPGARATACLTLERLGDRRVVPEVQRFVSDPDPGVRAAAERAVAALAAPSNPLHSPAAGSR
jgi:HEAT repeat protein